MWQRRRASVGHCAVEMRQVREKTLRRRLSIEAVARQIVLGFERCHRSRVGRNDARVCGHVARTQ